MFILFAAVAVLGIYLALDSAEFSVHIYRAGIIVFGTCSILCTLSLANDWTF